MSTDDLTTCSYCEDPATRVGGFDSHWGHDGDFYCEDHLHLAPVTTAPLDPEENQ